MRTVTIVVFLLLGFAAQSPLHAEQYVRGNQVVHTRVAPVIMHRVLPPYRGIHVYEGRGRR